MAEIGSNAAHAVGASGGTNSIGKGTYAVAAILRGLVFAVTWALLTRADASYLGYGLVLVPSATALSLAVSRPRMAPAPRTWLPRAGRFLLLLGWFAGQAFSGGVDVATRALRGPADIDPYVATLPARLRPGPARELAEAMINLMPGTVVEASDEDSVDLHVLGSDLDAAAQWAELENRVAAAAGITLSS
ncbi:Na+/H+ antiporter subunit E [uncultured Corynebacterium sp.]|uniref:Na+/H+ antiporter subunit E n=1 Tax=uncultured Corynebacterium sp. TaxID=159447 RepID=UPI0025E78E31|nr:Na+/H+ antiporter subunit E [uncultured Corynebacterium sp.]